MPRILHVSDLHFGWPAALAVIDALDARIAEERYNVVAISGDLSQRSKAGEFQRALVFLRSAARTSPTITVPGNHDVAWWFAPLGMGAPRRLYANYQRWIAPTLEPVLRVPGMTLVGLNTAHGVAWDTLTLNPRDTSIVGSLRASQIDRARAQFSASPTSDARIIVMHHNPTRGALSDRWGMTRAPQALRGLAGAGVELILCGHDHQEAIETAEGIVIAVAGTVSTRMRGHRPPSFNVCTVTDESIAVATQVWDGHSGFVPGVNRCFARRPSN